MHTQHPASPGSSIFIYEMTVCAVQAKETADIILWAPSRDIFKSHWLGNSYAL